MPAPAKPKYILKGPRDEKVTRTVYTKNVTKDEVGPLEMVIVEEVLPCYMLYIPHGPKGEMNSIRIISPTQLKELGIDPNFTPLVDEDGNVVGSFQNRVTQDYGPDPVMPRTKKGVE